MNRWRSIAVVICTFTAWGGLRAVASPPVAPTEALRPEEQRAKFKLPPGFAIQLVASESEIQKPMNLAFDVRGRLWVTHSVEYPFAAADDATPRDGLSVFEDFGPDGRARKAIRFADGLNIPIGVLPLPNAADTHGNQNAFRLGPDGSGRRPALQWQSHRRHPPRGDVARPDRHRLGRQHVSARELEPRQQARDLRHARGWHQWLPERRQRGGPSAAAWRPHPAIRRLELVLSRFPGCDAGDRGTGTVGLHGGDRLARRWRLHGMATPLAWLNGNLGKPTRVSHAGQGNH
jgi:hypothetical protein